MFQTRCFQCFKLFKKLWELLVHFVSQILPDCSLLLDILGKWWSGLHQATLKLHQRKLIWCQSTNLKFTLSTHHLWWTPPFPLFSRCWVSRSKIKSTFTIKTSRRCTNTSVETFCRRNTADFEMKSITTLRLTFCSKIRTTWTNFTASATQLIQRWPQKTRRKAFSKAKTIASSLIQCKREFRWSSKNFKVGIKTFILLLYLIVIFFKSQTFGLAAYRRSKGEMAEVKFYKCKSCDKTVPLCK